MLLSTAILVSALILGLLVSFKVVPALITFSLDRNLVDQPDTFRKRHLQPTPRIGGVGIFAGFGVALAYLFVIDAALGLNLTLPSWPLMLGGMAMFGVGLWDDLKELGFKKKLLMQIVVAYGVYVGGVQFDVSAMLGLPAEWSAYLALPLTMLWLVGMMNAINFIDGLDGLAGGVSLITLVGLAVLFGLQGNLGFMLVCVAAAGGILGFLVFNFNPASIFMGDSGSLTLGYILGTFALYLAPETMTSLSFAPGLVMLVLMGLPITDTSLSMVRRVASGKSMAAPDRDHIHHRLSNRMSVRHAVVLLYAVTAVLGLVAVALALVPVIVAVLLVVLTGVAAVTGLYQLGYIRPIYLAPRVRLLPAPYHRARQMAVKQERVKATRARATAIRTLEGVAESSQAA